MRRLRSWRPLFRLAWRDARRAKGRTLLVLVMVALPVLGVTAGDVLIQTSSVSQTEGLTRELGAADASVHFETTQVIRQTGDDENDTEYLAGRAKPEDQTLASIEKTLGRKVGGIQWQDAGTIVFRKGDSFAEAAGNGIDLSSPLVKGIYALTSGRAPRAPGEVAVSPKLATTGFGIGATISPLKGSPLTVVGVVASGSYRELPEIVGLPGTLPGDILGAGPRFLIGGGPVSWAEVGELNALGGRVLSREVVTNPPEDTGGDEMSYAGDNRAVQVALLIIVMALIELALLAGPAFAVGARRQARGLALLGATGGTRAQLRGVVLSGALLIGLAAAAVGVPLGILAARAGQPILQRFDTNIFGPFEVPWLHLVGFAVFAVVSCVLAAAVPAIIASRQDIVRVLSGRRGDAPANKAIPVFGLALFGLGITGAVVGPSSTYDNDYGMFLVAVCSVVAVLGLIMVLPILVSLVARFSGRLPLSVRYAVRDAARHRTRTVPAIAAVMATVAGVVALGITSSSDETENRESYLPLIPIGTGLLSADAPTEAQLGQLAAVIAGVVPEARIMPVTTLAHPVTEKGFLDYRISDRPAGTPSNLLNQEYTSFASGILVSDVVPPVTTGVSRNALDNAAAVLARGGAIVLTEQESSTGPAYVSKTVYTDDDQETAIDLGRVDAEFVQVNEITNFTAILSTEAAERLKLATSTTALAVDGASISGAQAKEISSAARNVIYQSYFNVERGYTGSDQAILLLVLASVGGLLMLGGTLTATFLALSDARRDLSTLAAVGASPRTRRRVAASYALVVGWIGSVTGALFGLVPGIATAYPLTGNMNSFGYGEDGGQHYLTIPWLMIAAIVFGLPLLTAAVVGVFSRSKLPMVERID